MKKQEENKVPLILRHYQIRPDHDTALKKKAKEQGVAVQKYIRDLFDANGICDTNRLSA